MASKTYTRTVPIIYDVPASPETIFHFPVSPSEPGKFDFYRVHLANHVNHSDDSFSGNFDAPVLLPSTSTPSNKKRRWTPFADLVSTNLNSSTTPSRIVESSVGLNTTGTQANTSSTSLTDAVKSAMDKGNLTVPSNQTRRLTSGITLSSKDLNHLSPQSM